MARFLFMTTLIYIHGFNSSPQSYKARVLQDYLQAHLPQLRYYCPALSDRPDQAIEQLQGLVESSLDDIPLLIGSSLGGYYATWLACRYGLRAALINPAVRPYDLLVKYLGPNRNYHTDEEFVLTEEHMEALRRLETQAGPCYEELDVYLETGDETLDYRDAEAKYARARQYIFPGGSHAFVNFEGHLSDILERLGIFPGLQRQDA